MPKTFTNKVQVKTENGAMKLKILGVPFGGHIKGRDFDGDYFSPDTYFGDDCGVNQCYVTLDHALVKDDSGRIIVHPKDAFVGQAKYVETDAAGRWYEASITKGKAYQDAIQALSDAGMLYASSQPIQTSVTKNSDQHIGSWVVGEIALTSHPNNLLAAAQIMSKSFEGLNAKAEESVEPVVSDDFVIEDVEEADVPATQTEEPSLSDEIEGILTGSTNSEEATPEETSGETAEVKAIDIDAQLKKINSSIGAYIDFWGNLEGDETLAELVMRMVEMSAKTFELTEKAVELATKNQQELVAQRAALKTYAEHTAKTMDTHIKNVIAGHVKNTMDMSEAEKKAYEAKLDAQKQTSPVNKYHSPVPPGAPGES